MQRAWQGNKLGLTKEYLRRRKGVREQREGNTRVQGPSHVGTCRRGWVRHLDFILGEMDISWILIRGTVWSNYICKGHSGDSEESWSKAAKEETGGREKVFWVIQGGDSGGPNQGGEKWSMLGDIWNIELIEIANGLECEMKKRE